MSEIKSNSPPTKTDKEFLLQITTPTVVISEEVLAEWSLQQKCYDRSRRLVVIVLMAWIFLVSCVGLFITRPQSFFLFTIFIATCIAVILVDLKLIKKILRCPNCRKVPFLIEKKGILRFKKTITKSKDSCLYCGVHLVRNSKGRI